MAYTTIKKPSDYFNIKLYTGNGSTQSITGVGFQPDWTWIKCRSGVESHVLFDAVRGAQKAINSNTTDAEATSVNYLSAFGSDGFSVGSSGLVNSNSATYASWNWLANNTSGSSNTDGSITSTVSANTTAGFSIVSWTGTGSNATVGHGLGSAPKMIIFKRLDSADDMTIYHTSLGATKKIDLNNTGASSTVSSVFNDTAPTNSLIYVGTNGRTNASGGSYIAYCFAEKTGYSKFSSYTGAGSNLPFIYTGFKPAFIMIKSSDGAYPWSMYDVKRLGYNVYNSRVVADDNIAEQGSQHLDILSNGFKLRTAGAGENGSGGNFIYMAFAEEPLVGDNPATAR